MRALSSVLGIWVWGALLRRELLCIPESIFKFVRVHQYRVVQWWPSARREAKAMARAVPLMFLDVGAPLLGVVGATDAMGPTMLDAGGYGVVASVVPRDVLERTFEQASVISYTVARLDGSLSGLKNPAKELRGTIPVSRVPRELFR